MLETYVRLCYYDLMEQKKRKIRSLIILAGVVLCAALCLILRSAQGAGRRVLVTLDGQAYRELPLDRDIRFTVETSAGYNIVVIEDGKVFVSEADCTNQVCVRTGEISQKGEVIACLPHSLLIEICGRNGEVDAVAR